MKILAIETSCDDTGIAVLEYSKTSQPKILADFVSSQTKIHAPWGGVVPMLAEREHQKNLVPLLIKALKKSALLKTGNLKIKPQNRELKTLGSILDREPELLKKLPSLLEKYQKPDIDHIAVTIGPGLEPALWAGINFARALSFFWNIPLLPANHIEGHLCANFADGKISAEKLFPTLALVVSGGHTQLIMVKGIGRYEIVGETRDDAAGEAFDKVAKMLNLGYPGGPAISRLAEKWQSQISRFDSSEARQAGSKSQNTRLNHSIIQSLNHFTPLPRPMLNSGDFDFSFSGLKTAVLYALQKMTPAQIKKQTPAIAAEFEQAVIDVLTAKTLSAVKKYQAKTIMLAGGVASNRALRQVLADKAKELNLAFSVPGARLCTDNAAMIALAAFYGIKKRGAKKADWRTLRAQANLRIS